MSTACQAKRARRKAAKDPRYQRSKVKKYNFKGHKTTGKKG